MAVWACWFCLPKVAERFAKADCAPARSPDCSALPIAWKSCSRSALENTCPFWLGPVWPRAVRALNADWAPARSPVCSACPSWARSANRCCRIALVASKRCKRCLRARQVAGLQGLAEGIERLGATGLGKRFRIGERPSLPKHSQGAVGLLSARQIPTLKSAAELLKIGLTVLVEALELLKNR